MNEIVFNDNVITPTYCINENFSTEVGQDNSCRQFHGNKKVEDNACK